MKKILVISLAIAGLALASCNKDITAPEGGKLVRIAASSTETVTKVYGNAQGRFYWDKNDRLGVWTGNELTQFTIGAGWDGMTYAEFEGTVPEGGAIDANSFAFYPYNDEISFEGSVATLPEYGGWAMNYPTKQIYLYATEAPSYEDGIASTFKFQHVTAYFRLTLNNVAVGAKALYIECWCPNASGNNGQYILNGGTIDASNGTLAANTCDWAFIPLPEHSAVINSMTITLPIIPGTYGDRAKFRICACTNTGFGNEMEGCDFSAFITLNAQAGDYYVFPAITFPNEKSADDSGTGINEGIEDPVINEQAGDFWKIG